MSGPARIPYGSQTVGPYFTIGLQYLLERTLVPGVDAHHTIEICGRVVDRDGAAVPDAMLEFWCAATVGDGPDSDGRLSGLPAGFRRAVTDDEGRYSAVIERPAPAGMDNGLMQAPYMLVLVFARGLMRHLLTRVYLGDEHGNAEDTVLLNVPEERRVTLIARPDERRVGVYWWDVVLQGTGETVFFVW